MDMNYEEFSRRLIHDQLPVIQDRMPLPRIVRETTGMYSSYVEWAYNNRNLLNYVEPKQLYDLSPFGIQSMKKT